LEEGRWRAGNWIKPISATVMLRPWMTILFAMVISA